MKSHFADSVVIDANVFVKLLHAEHDIPLAFDFLDYCIAHDILIVAPTLFDYEVISVCVRLHIELNEILALLADYRATNLVLQVPDFDDWQLASKICQDGNAKSGYPSMYDSIYQAMAINRNITFVSADTRHIAKANKHGNVCALAEWRDIFNHF